MLRLYVLLSFCFLQGVFSKHCYWNSGCPYKYFSSKTPYDDIRGDLRDVPNLEACTPVSIWSLHRHGSRHPGEDDTVEMRETAAKLKDQIIANHAVGRGQLCAQDIDNLRDWQWDETLDITASYLTDMGFDELLQLGHRVRVKYSKLMSNSPDSYYFRPTAEQRTVMSAKAFVQGLGEGSNFSSILDKPRQKDDVIRPYKDCAKYEQKKGEHPTAKDHVKEYYRTEEFQNLIKGIEKRLGLREKLTSNNVTGLYNLCRFYRSFHNDRRSPWCSVFSHADLVALEYVEDINHYYRNGYGAALSAELGKTALRDMYEHFQAVHNGTGRTMVGYFTHDTMMEMVFCSLGLFKDSFDINGDVRRHPRKWRTSLMAPFATNLMVVMHECRVEDIINFKIQFFLNEQEYFICSERACSWDEFKDKFEPFANATLDFCELSSGEAKGVKFLYKLI